MFFHTFSQCSFVYSVRRVSLSSCQQRFYVQERVCHCKICIHEKDESIANERGERWQKTNEKPSFIESNEVNECLKMDCIMCDAVRVVESCYYYNIRNSSVGGAFLVCRHPNAHKMQNRRKRMVLFEQQQRRKKLHGETRVKDDTQIVRHGHLHRKNERNVVVTSSEWRWNRPAERLWS